MMCMHEDLAFRTGSIPYGKSFGLSMTAEVPIDEYLEYMRKVTAGELSLDTSNKYTFVDLNETHSGDPTSVRATLLNPDLMQEAIDKHGMTLGGAYQFYLGPAGTGVSYCTQHYAASSAARHARSSAGVHTSTGTWHECHKPIQCDACPKCVPALRFHSSTSLSHKCNFNTNETFEHCLCNPGSRPAKAPVHTHTQAFNVLVHGRKRWYLLPQRHAMYSKQPIADWIAEGNVERLSKIDGALYSCVQEAGDVMYVHMLTHAVSMSPCAAHVVLATQLLIACNSLSLALRCRCVGLIDGCNCINSQTRKLANSKSSCTRQRQMAKRQHLICQHLIRVVLVPHVRLSPFSLSHTQSLQVRAEFMGSRRSQPRRKYRVRSGVQMEGSF